MVTGTKILGFGGYQPDKVVTNDDLAKTVETNDEWIRSRVGIESRRVARDDETVADMAEAAGDKAGDPLAALSVSAPSVRYTPERSRMFLHELRTTVATAQDDIAF